MSRLHNHLRWQGENLLHNKVTDLKASCNENGMNTSIVRERATLGRAICSSDLPSPNLHFKKDPRFPQSRLHIISGSTVSNMPGTDYFSFFGLLPKELREQIWQFSLEPRLIKLKYDTYSLDITDPPNFLYLLGGYFPYTHFTMEDIERPEEPYRTGHLFPSKVVSPPALAVHRESRDFLIFLGYISWTVENPLWGTRDFRWHPKLDIISLPGNETFSPGLHRTPYLHVFMQQFPAQARLLRKIALSSTCWKRNEAIPMDSAKFLLNFESLTNLVVVLDEEYETHLISWQLSLTGPNQTVTMSNDINELLERVKAMLLPPVGMQRTTPEVQLVWTEDAALPYINTERSKELLSTYHYRNIFPF